MKFNDAVSGGALLALAVAVIAYARGLPKMPGQFVGPGLFPTVVAAALAVGALVLIARGLRARAAGGEAGRAWLRLDAWARSPAALLRLLAIPAFILAYVLLSERIGFVPVAVAGLAGLMLLAGVRRPTALAVAAAATAAVYYAFAVVLRVPLPRTGFLGLPF